MKLWNNLCDKTPTWTKAEVYDWGVALRSQCATFHCVMKSGKMKFIAQGITCFGLKSCKSCLHIMEECSVTPSYVFKEACTPHRVGRSIVSLSRMCISHNISIQATTTAWPIKAPINTIHVFPFSFDHLRWVDYMDTKQKGFDITVHLGFLRLLFSFQY